MLTSAGGTSLASGGTVTGTLVTSAVLISLKSSFSRWARFCCVSSATTMVVGMPCASIDHAVPANRTWVSLMILVQFALVMVATIATEPSLKVKAIARSLFTRLGSAGLGSGDTCSGGVLQQS